MGDRLPPPMPGHMPSSFDDNEEFFNERPMQKVARKLKEEPLVPLGIGLTVFAFVGAYRALRRGDSRQANKMFRARVAAQGFTVLAMVAGSMYYSQDRQKTKELRKLKGERDAEEKRQKWIKELEARDEEEKLIRASMDKRRQKLEAANAAAGNSEEGTASGGILGKIGLWSKGQAAAETMEVAKEEPRKQNPKSSLGAISDALAKRKENDGKK
ncbi:mitochondrial hypoxia responsive domain-containing protein [Metarhizium album ARSEF 1941]|uniref:Mitochondrial hypoxia responsive domain-containing protein n=1 Tax=Metarhizium album (strain ARSEF 1941) TaxID=1081103 RepID=A0A0B2WLF4_METAS|nr:mitochondrial hypoxia responsive domain-containing protein [Metarhizium album ARSEF 1941]KHN94529.1 mitochondrial hypoxia responsive domain-containing protein [Metarhizium album ARSEF 1941]